MKKLKIAICAVLVLFCSLIFVGCNEAELQTFNADLFKVTKAEVVYDGNSHIYEVEYKGVELDITYSVDKVIYKDADQFSFKDAGTYNLYYKVSAEGYETYASSEAVEFKILPKTATIKVGDSIICKTDNVTTISPEYTIAGLVAGDEINVSFGIGKNANSGAAYDKENVVYGQKYKYDISYENHKNYNIVVDSNVGSIVVKDYYGVKTGSVETYTNDIASAYAMLEEGSIITLYKDIDGLEAKEYTADEKGVVEGTGLDVLVKDNRVDLRAINKSYDFVIDLNGHNFNARLDFRNWESKPKYYNNDYTIKVVVKDSKSVGVVGSDENDYGITVFGNNKITVTMQNITAKGYYGGICYSGNCEGSRIVATNCTFEGVETEEFVTDKDKWVGAYLPGKGQYVFNDCSFKGYTAYYTKSGEHVLTNCKFYATGEYRGPAHNGSGCIETGSAFVVDSATGYLQPITISIIGGTFNSAHGFCIEELSTAATGLDKICYATVNVYGNVNFERYDLDKIYSQNNKVIVSNISE